MPPVTDEVHDHVARERLAILERHLSNTHYGVQVFSIDVENGNRLALGQRRSKARGMKLRRRGREAEQIIYDDMDRASDRIGFQIGEVHCFRPDSLTGKRDRKSTRLNSSHT